MKLKIKKMKLKIKKMFCLFLISMLPLQINISPEDSSETNFQFTGGIGQYVNISRGCSGEVLDKETIPFQEIGVSVDHKTGKHWRLGLQGSYIFSQKHRELSYEHGEDRYVGKSIPTQIFILNPYVNFESKYFALGGGYIFANDVLPASDDTPIVFGKNYPSGYLRLGNVKTFYVDASLFHTTPLLSSNYIKYGLGFQINPKIDFWIGSGIAPYDQGGIIAKTHIQIQPNLYLNALARIGSSEGISENAIGLGLTYQLKGK